MRAGQEYDSLHTGEEGLMLLFFVLWLTINVKGEWDIYSNIPEILEDGTKYYPPIDSCAYDEHELDMYFIGDDYGKEEE